MSNNSDTSPFVLSVSPHIRHENTVPGIMRTVVYALIPAFLASVVFFGPRVVLLVAICVIFSLCTEWIIAVRIMKRANPLGDYSALVTGLLIAFNLPPHIPLWMGALGAIFAIGVVKWTFGGLGHNFVNPALAGRAFLLASYPGAMTDFSTPSTWLPLGLGTTMHGLPGAIADKVSVHIDGLSSATPLAAFSKIHQFFSMSGDTASFSFEILDFGHALKNLFIGNTGGSLGETSSLALILGAVFMLYRRVIGFRIPVAYIGTVFILTWLFYGSTHGFLTSATGIVCVYHIFSGGLMLGALFMATDMVTSPITARGRIIFGIGCGILTFTIRNFGGYPEGVCYSILLMNLVVPLIDRYTKPRVYGT